MLTAQIWIFCVKELEPSKQERLLRAFNDEKRGGLYECGKAKFILQENEIYLQREFGISGILPADFCREIQDLVYIGASWRINWYKIFEENVLGEGKRPTDGIRWETNKADYSRAETLLEKLAFVVKAKTSEFEGNDWQDKGYGLHYHMGSKSLIARVLISEAKLQLKGGEIKSKGIEALREFCHFLTIHVAFLALKMQGLVLF